MGRFYFWRECGRLKMEENMTRKEAGCLIQECSNNIWGLTEGTFYYNRAEVCGRLEKVIAEGIHEIRDREIHDSYIAILRRSSERLKQLEKNNIKEMECILRSLHNISV